MKTAPRPAPSNRSRPPSVGDITARNVRAVAKLEDDARSQRSLSDRVADLVARFCGSMTFFWFHVAWFAIWIGVNLLPLGIPRFDPFPFTFLTLVVSLEAIFLSTFILISQNEDARIADRRNHLDLQINLLAEQENTKMLNMLRCISEAVGARCEDDQEAAALEEATKPGELVKQIERSMEEAPPAGRKPAKP